MTFWKTAALFLALVAPAAEAQELSDEARAALSETVDRYHKSMTAGDWGATFDYMPPKILADLVREGGGDEALIMETTKSLMEEAMAIVTIESFSFDLEAATVHLTPDGSITYILIPTEAVVTVDGMGKMKNTGDTLAFEDAGEWYLYRIELSGEDDILKAAYPAFEGVSFEGEIIEPVAE
ncbi:hypothetical protein [Tabrizicola sp.]|uniref:hypothetical protein n=1 Tax=Tabrizicola sp. TaxID=2005166 RepID=UPI003F3906D8